MIADDIIAESVEGRDEGLSADAEFLRLNQSSVARGSSEIAADCAADCIARVSDIASECSVKSQPWTDPDFDLRREVELSPSLADHGGNAVDWVPIHSIFENGGELFLHSRTEGQPRHVEIGQYDSSSLFTAAALLTYAQLKALVIAYDAYANVYGLRLFLNGRWQFVLVDGVIGCTQTDAGTTVPVFARSGVVGELWPILLEKAYMKVRGGCASRPVDTVEDAWQLLSGGMATAQSPPGEAVDVSLVNQVCTALICPDIAVAYQRSEFFDHRGREPERSPKEVRAGAADPTSEIGPLFEVVDSVRESAAEGLVVKAHSANPGRPTAVEIVHSDLEARVKRLIMCHTVPPHWSLSHVFGALVTQQSLDLAVITVAEDLRCLIGISPWKTAETVGEGSSDLGHRLRFSLMSMSKHEWDQFDGSRKVLIELLRNQMRSMQTGVPRQEGVGSPNTVGSATSQESLPAAGAAGPAETLSAPAFEWPPSPSSAQAEGEVVGHPPTTSLAIGLSSDRVYFLVPHLVAQWDKSAVSQPSGRTDEAVGYTLRVCANKFCIRLESYDTTSSTISRAVVEFGIYRPGQRKARSRRESSDGSPVNVDGWIHIDSTQSSEPSPLTSPSPYMGQLQNIRIVVLSDEVATLMGQCPRVRLKHCRLCKSSGSPIGLTLFSPKGEEGVYIRNIREGSAADRASRLNVSDVLLEVNGVATFKYGAAQGADGISQHRRLWCTHEQVVQLLVRSGNNFSMLVCSQDDFKAISSEAGAVAAPASCVAMEESGHVKLMPRVAGDKNVSSGRFSFRASQLSTIGQYREWATSLHELHADGHLEENEYKACLKAALANAYWSSGGTT